MRVLGGVRYMASRSLMHPSLAVLDITTTVHQKHGSPVPEVLTPGSYRFPFAIALPTGLLASHFHRPLTTYRAHFSKRVYHVDGFVDVPNWFDLRNPSTHTRRQHACAPAGGSWLTYDRVQQRSSSSASCHRCCPRRRTPCCSLT